MTYNIKAKILLAELAITAQIQGELNIRSRKITKPGEFINKLPIDAREILQSLKSDDIKEMFFIK